MTIWINLARKASFETKRLRLTPLTFEQREDFFAISSCPANLSFIFPAKSSKAESDDFFVKTFLKNPLGKWGIKDTKSERLIGIIFLSKIDEKKELAEVEYFLHRDCWGQGYMTEALRGLVQAVSAFLELRLVVHEENLASQKVAQKVGFQSLKTFKGSDRYTHKMRTYLLYGIKQGRGYE